MNNKEVMAIQSKLFEDALSLGNLKGGEYASSTDRLANFKRNAKHLGLTPLQVWGVYFGKHIDSIHTYIQKDARGNEQVVSEPIESRILDAIVYLSLLKGLLIDLKHIDRPKELNELSDEFVHKG